MSTETDKPKKKRSVKKIILRSLAVFLVLIIAGAVFLYYNLNRILTSALQKSFNENIISDVYELKFEKLSVNFVLGDVKVYNVELKPREKPLQTYSYINSSFSLKAQKMILKNVELKTLIKSKILKLEKIEIAAPGIDFTIADMVPIFFPFKDSKTDSGQVKNKKRSIELFVLKEFKMVDASFHVMNYAREREFNIKKINLLLTDILVDQQSGKDVIAYNHFDFSIGDFSGNLRKKGIKNVQFKDFKIKIDSLRVEKTVDSITYHFADFKTGLKSLDILTADSTYHVMMKSFDLSYKDKSIILNDVSFKPNVSDAALQAAYKFQHTEFSGSVGTLKILGVNFDEMAHKQKIFIDEINLDKVSASIFKDKSKPVDVTRIPKYLGQTITGIGAPLVIKKLKATNVTLVNRERNPDGSISIANLHRANVEASNITNLSNDGTLLLKAEAYLENKARFNLNLMFSYNEPQFGFNGSFAKFNLADLNPLIQSYTPASINKGVVDELTFSGTIFWTRGTGTMKFLYHDLDINLELDGKAKWKSQVLAFGANNLLPSSNPASASMPPRVVTFDAERDMNKSFVNITIRSLLDGLKETLVMSKENKKTFKKEKKEAKKEARKEKKEAKKKAREQRKKNKQ